MPNGKKKESVTPEPITPEQSAPEPTKQELMAQLQTALTAGDYKEVTRVSRLIDQKERASEKAELETKRKELEQMSESVKAVLVETVQPMVDSGQLDKADGIWFAWDFGEPAPSVRLMKTATRTPRAGGGGTGKKFGVSTDSLLEKYGAEPYKETGMTFKAAYDSNTDKNWRYAIRQALLKKDGII